MSHYNRSFYEMQMEGSERSASIVVPMVLDLVKVRSVCDVGCGVGTWLRIFIEHGVSDAIGLDGAYVERQLLRIPEDRFSSTDLRKEVRLARRFDLAVSLEVAEHLPPSRAAGFVEDLTRLAPIVLFSAAIPNQGGVDHINEQWPSWWASLFARHGYAASDALRRGIWGNPEVTPCYRQNILIFANPEACAANPELKATPQEQLDIAHPLFYSKLIPTDDLTLVAKHLYWRIWHRLKQRVHAS